MSGICRFLLVSLVIAFGCKAGSLPPVSDADREGVVRGNNRFAFELYARLKEEEGNLFLSPHSISTALSMTYAGARGNTQLQMADVLHFDLPQKRLHPAMGDLIARLNARGKEGDYELTIANALWGQKGYTFLEGFLEITRTNYGAGLKEVDFGKAAEDARKTINTWVEKETMDKIKDLIKPGILTPLTRLVLTNAIYFKGDWASQFDEQNTKDAPFHIGIDNTVQVPMMYQKAKFRYMETDKFQAIELLYINDELSMVVLLPKKIDGLSELENALDEDSLNKYLSNFRSREVRVYLPKFKVTSEFGLGGVLASMGMPGVFSLPPADFSGMTGERDLFISAVVHKAFVDVNEEGTEAAAATGVGMQITAVMPTSIFRADHPFLFLIRDTSSSAILFLGRLVEPAS